MPTLLQINVTCNSGSTGKIAEQIGSLALKNGWRSIIAYSRGNAESESETIKIGNRLNIYWHGIESRIFDNHGLSSRLATKKFVKRILEISPDIIHLHNIHGYYLNYKILFEFLKKYNRPIVWTLHDCWAFTGHCGHFTMANCYKWKTQCFDCPLKKDYPKSFLFDRSRQNYIDKKESFTGLRNLHIVSVSNWLNEIVKESFLNYANLHVINNGIDISKFSPCEKNKNGKFAILGVSNVWDESKGLYDFFKLRKLLPEDFSITLVGLTKGQLKNLPEGISGITRTESQKELANLYSKSDVLISLSHAETFGLTIAEAYACGIPAIVYDNTALPELIPNNNSTGFIVKTGDVESVAFAVKKLKGSPILAANCRKRAETLYDKNIAFGKYLELYEKILNHAF